MKKAEVTKVNKDHYKVIWNLPKDSVLERSEIREIIEIFDNAI